ncbi:hypothetical protein ACK2M2_15415 [Acinetobacter sp. TY1]|uniref:hypothetical protein n=1 Tax=unclassified Acinetobacter TaxID=196816 RepID=UPI00391795BC
MIFYTTSDEITMSALHRTVYLAKATFYQKFFIDVDKAQNTLAWLISKFHVSKTGDSRSKARDKKDLCNAHLVIQLNQQLLRQGKCQVFVMVTLPSALREKQSVITKMIEEFHLTEVEMTKMTAEQRFQRVISYQKQLIKKSFKEKDGRPCQDTFHCLLHRDSRLQLFSQDMPKVVLRLSDRSKKRLAEYKLMQEKKGDAKLIKPTSWTWHLTPQYKAHILKLCRAGIQSKLTQKKHIKKQQFEAKNKVSPTKDQVKTWLTDDELKKAIEAGVFALSNVPAFRGTTQDVGEICYELEKKYNRRAVRQNAVKGKRQVQKKRTFPIYQAFDLEQIKREAFYSTRVDFNIYSFTELHERVMRFTQTILSYKAENHVDQSLSQIEDEKALEKYIYADLLRINQAKNRNLADPKPNVEVRDDTENDVKNIIKKIKYNK